MRFFSQSIFILCGELSPHLGALKEALVKPVSGALVLVYRKVLKI